MRIGPRKTPDPSIAAAAAAFQQDDAARMQEVESNPIMAFLDAHEQAGSPNELTITGVADIKVSLGDLRRFVRLVVG